MADLGHLIKTILADTKFAQDGDPATKVYRDEPILFTASQMERQSPSRYRAMRKIARDNGLRQASEAKIFYEQGRFMADFEDEFDYPGEFVRYFPTYQAMSDQQLRGYFSWRTRLRRGRVERTSLSFAFVYIYELLHQIGVSSAEEGFYALKNFWLAYKEIDPKIDGYVRIWLKDYVVYYNLDRSLLADFYETDFDRSVLILLNYKSHGPEEVFAALNSLSAYNLEKSRFFKQHPEELKAVTYEVYSAFSDYYGQKRKKSLCEKFFGQVYSGSYFMFKSAVFCNRIPRQDYVYEISDIYKFTCRNGNWFCERFFRYGDKNQPIGDMLKTIDFLMRQRYGFKSALKPGRTTKTLDGLINKALDDFEEKKKLAARAEIKIDLSKLQNIRAASLETQSKLIVAESAEPEPPEETAAQEAGPANPNGLSALEHQFLGGLLSGRADEELVRSQGLMPSLVIDSINEKLFERFGDSVIIEAGGRPELVEDYLDELKEMIAE